MPNEDERTALMGLIKDALDKNAEWDAAVREESEIRTRLKALEQEHLHVSADDLDDWQRKLDAIGIKESAMRQSFSTVIAAVQSDYGVGPGVRQGPIKGGLMDRQEAVWAPIIQEKADLVYRVDRPGKRSAFLKWQEARQDGGETLDDGTVFISLRILERCQDLGSPAVLAAIVDHEAAHSEGLVSKDGWSGRESGEAGAYGREIATGERIGLEKSENDFIQGEWGRHYSASLARELGSAMRGKPYHAPPNSKDYPYQLKADENYADWMRVQTRLREISRQRDELNRRLRAGEGGESGASQPSRGGDAGLWPAGVPTLPDQQILVPPAPPTTPAIAQPMPASPVVRPPAPVPVVLPFDAWAALKDLAERGCADPQSVPEAEFNRTWMNVRGVVNNPQAAQILGLNGCPAILLAQLMAQGSSYQVLTWKDFATEAFAARGQVSPSPGEDGGRRGGRSTTPSDPCSESGSFEGVRTGCPGH